MGLGAARLGKQPLIINQRWKLLFLGVAARPFDISATTRWDSGWSARLFQVDTILVAQRTPFNLSSWRWQTFSCNLGTFQETPSVQDGVVEGLVCQPGVRVEI